MENQKKKKKCISIHVNCMRSIKVLESHRFNDINNKLRFFFYQNVISILKDGHQSDKR